MTQTQAFDELKMLIGQEYISDALRAFEERIGNLRRWEQIIIYGAGARGRDLQSFLETFSIETSLFLDKNAGSIGTINGTPVKSADAVKGSDVEKQNAYVFNAVNDGDDETINQSLRDLGYTQICSLSKWWFFNCWRTRNDVLRLPEKSRSITRTLPLWADDKSIETYLNNLRCYITREYIPGTKIENEDQYFPRDFALSKGYDHFVDCGAYTGDTIHSLANNIGSIESLVSFEPDQTNFPKLQKTLSATSLQIKGEVVLYPLAVWSKTEMLRFKSRGGSGSLIHDAGEGLIQGVALDDVLCTVRPTCIKMDIEGAELAGLKGARRIIQATKPDLAICVYHDINHLWDIPLLVASWDLGYEFYLREYQTHNHETVMYATCPENS